MTIYFYSTTNEYGFISNFSRYGFGLDGQYWLTVEHYFQAQKFIDMAYSERIRLAKTAKDAKKLGQSRKHPIRDDWEIIKDDVMRRAIQAKFETHADIRERQLATGDEDLVEHARSDYYWGSGADGSGENMLGKILMDLRDSLKK
jgi:ribA/ribD-fused uncharacterized protein